MKFSLATPSPHSARRAPSDGSSAANNCGSQALASSSTASDEPAAPTAALFTAHFGSPPDLFVVSEPSLVPARLSLVTACWAKDLRTRFHYDLAAPLDAQLRLARESKTRFVLLLDPSPRAPRSSPSDTSPSPSRTSSVLVLELDYASPSDSPDSLSFGSSPDSLSFGSSPSSSLSPSIGPILSSLSLPRSSVIDKLLLRLHAPSWNALDSSAALRHASPHRLSPSPLSSPLLLAPPSSTASRPPFL